MDVAVVGAGYVGVPARARLRRAGRSVLLVDVGAGGRRRPSTAARATSRTSRPTDARASRRGGPDHRDDATTTSSQRRRDPDRPADAAHEAARARPLDRRDGGAPRSRRGCGRASSSCSSRRPIPARPARSCCRSSSGSGLKAGVDFHLAFSPERVDPGTHGLETKSVPKIVGGITEACTEARREPLRGPRSTPCTPVSSPEAAELTKLLENIFRSVNIALVNELAQLCDRMDIDVWEVVGAAATKPFGFMRFEPGPGPRRPLHPDRPLLPDLEGARVRLLRPSSSSWPGEVNDEHAPLLPLADLAGAEPRAAALAERLAGCSCSASPTRRTSGTCASRRRRS